MRPTMILFILASSLSATAAFATQRASVNVPFSFESHGKQFPAGNYDVVQNGSDNFLTMSSSKRPEKNITWVTGPTDVSTNSPSASIEFDQVGNTHELHAIRIGNHATPVLDKQWKVSTANQMTALVGP
jgi:hypothetical protein